MRWVYIHRVVKRRNPPKNGSVYYLRRDSKFSKLCESLRRYRQLVKKLGDHKVFFSLEAEPLERLILPPAFVQRPGGSFFDIDPQLNEGEDLSTLTLEELLFGRCN